MGWIIAFVVLTVLIAIFCHAFIRQWWLAMPLAAVWSSTAFQCLGRIHLGYWDSFAIIAWIIGIGLGLIVSGIVAIPFVVIRWNRRSNRNRRVKRAN